MITCPYCGTHYLSFQPNCKNCGAPLTPPSEGTLSQEDDLNVELPNPPPAPRPISNGYAWRLLSGDGGWIVSLVFVILGGVFSVVGAGLTIAIITAFIGLPFLLMGLVFLGGGGYFFLQRYQWAQKVVGVLRDGAAGEGQVSGVQENYSVEINGRHPWTIAYAYRVSGQAYTGKVTTLIPPGPRLQAGRAVRVLYLAAEPGFSSIYPHP